MKIQSISCSFQMILLMNEYFFTLKENIGEVSNECIENTEDNELVAGQLY